MKSSVFVAGVFAALALTACGGMSHSTEPRWTAKDPGSTPVVAVDRFSSAAGHLQVRTAQNGLPGPNAPVNFDQGPFITHGFGPAGEPVQYYNFDVQPKVPADIFVFFKKGASTPVEGQLNVIDVIPGDAGYNDFWNIHKVTVPDDYVVNAVTSLAGILNQKLPVEKTPMLVNCPVVPAGSTASRRFSPAESTALHRGWYKDKVVNYFSFEERALAVDSLGEVPDSDIYVTFKLNPNPADPATGPASGFLTEGNGLQTHNVVMTTPLDAGYSPLWDVQVYDNSGFAKVRDLGSASTANILAAGVAKVNCPIVIR